MAQGLDPKTHNLIPSRQRAVNKVACNISPSNHEPFSIISHDSKMKDVSLEIINPPILALVSPNNPSNCSTQPPFFQTTTSLPLPKSCYDNPGVIWNANSQNSHDSSPFTCVSSIENSLASSSSSSSANPTGFGLVDENCFWSCSNIVEPFEAAKIFESMPSQDQENQLNKICDTKIVDKNKGVHDNMEASFDTSSYDLGLVDSTLFPGSMCHDLSSMDDLAWDF
ncbi:hypothetical protein SADUNF_Sadunf10G0132800 [Salix dunnii]|uniref:Uncharacterized protein n=1 Tax=Salix dunnii TaxID=1413687 RepID=A0A835JSV5_9ROSI|nr:hypothetical protein SADUNF_Sadunf10G0132800 [Salix dunnii]